MAYTKYSLTPANNTATPPDGAPEGMLPSAVNDTMRDMMAQIRDCGDGIRDGTYTMTAAKITGGTITGVTFTGNTFSNPTITGVSTFAAGTVSAPAITTTGDTNTGIFFPAADTIAFTEGGVESMRIDSSGNVGIGTSSPSKKLQVAGDIVMTGSDGMALNPVVEAGSLFINRNGTLTSNVQFGGTTSNISGGSGGGSRIAIGTQLITFSTFPATTNAGDAITLTERMRITSGGEVLIGNTTTINGGKLYSESSTTPAEFYSTGAAGNAGMFVEKSVNDSTTSNVFVRFFINNGSAGSGQINANGASSAAFGTYSDERLKQNIEDLPSQLENIKSLRPVEFDYKAGGHQIGFVAQEMQEIYPDTVGMGEDGMLTITGWDKTTARLVKAIQEQQAMIEELKTKVTTLENK